jgi:hypothetical protein
LENGEISQRSIAIFRFDEVGSGFLKAVHYRRKETKPRIFFLGAEGIEQEVTQKRRANVSEVFFHRFHLSVDLLEIVPNREWRGIERKPFGFGPLGFIG